VDAAKYLDQGFRSIMLLPSITINFNDLSSTHLIRHMHH